MEVDAIAKTVRKARPYTVLRFIRLMADGCVDFSTMQAIIEGRFKFFDRFGSIQNIGLPKMIRNDAATSQSRPDLSQAWNLGCIILAGLLDEETMYKLVRGDFHIIDITKPGERSCWTTVEDLKFTTRTTNCLTKAGIRFLYQLPGKTERELLKIQFFGRKSLLEVKEALCARELSLGLFSSPFSS